jgi:hypothetical protein
MIDSKRTNVYILGAGASKDDGAPLMNEFFERAFTGIGGEIIPDPDTGKKAVDFDGTLGLPDDEEEIKIYERLAKKLDQTYGTEFGKDILLGRTRGEEVIPSFSSKAPINIEQVLSEIDEAIKGETDFHGYRERIDLKSLCDDLHYVIFDTLGNAIGLKRPPKRYLDFVNKKLIHSDIHIIITFNYDVLLEEALNDPELFYRNKYENSAFNVENCENRKSPWSYELDFIDLNRFESYSMSSDFVKVLKLHGSLNWSRCPKCGGFLLRRSASFLAYKIVIQGKINCPRCHVIAEPVLIPPLRYKHIDDPNIRKIWDLSRDWLNKADTISIIGYSLPQSDEHVLKLLEHAGNDKGGGYVLNIINPDVAVQNRFCNILSKGASEVRKYHYFYEYIEGPK